MMYNMLSKKFYLTDDNITYSHYMFLIWLVAILAMFIGFYIPCFPLMFIGIIVGLFSAFIMTALEVLVDIRHTGYCKIFYRVLINSWYIIGLVALFILLHS